MISPQEAQDRCARLIEFATKAGADAADAVCTASMSESIGVWLGKVEDIERSEGEDIGLRAFIGQRSASVSTSDFSDAALADMAERAVAMARGRVAGWSDALRDANMKLAAGACVLALVLAMPFWDFGAISTKNQLARLDRGAVTAEEFDFAALRCDFGAAGQGALAKLTQR